MVWMQKTISLSEDADKNLRVVRDVLGFSSETDAYKFCVALALRFQIEEPAYSGGGSTKWAVGSWDEGGELGDLLGAVYGPEADYNEKLKLLADAGIRRVCRYIENDYLETIPEILEQMEES
jgi:hypothetical protein